MSQPFSVARRVEFCETDAAGIAHFSAFLCYMEQAEHALLRHVGASVVRDLGDGWHVSWPRVHVECDYHGSARFEDCLTILVRVKRLGQRSVTYAFDFLRGEQSLAVGEVVAVCCKVHRSQSLESIDIPEELRSELRAFLV